MELEKGTRYHDMLLGAVMLIEVLVKDKNNSFEDVIKDIKFIYYRDNKEEDNE